MTMLTRRSLLKLSALSPFASALLARPAFAGTQTARAQNLIVLWMNGGPSHIDTWDPKTGTTGGKHKSIATKIPGVRISEHLPRLAAMADKLCIVRGLSSKEGNHQRAQYLLHTGYSPNPTVVHPSLGAWVSEARGVPSSGLPGFVSLGGPSHGGGLLGVQHNPFVLAKSGQIPENVARADAVSEDRFARREALLKEMDHAFAEQTGDIKVTGRARLYEKAIAMMRSKDVAAFDLSRETADVKTAFGDTDFGRNCLTALRLLQAGVRVTEVVLDGWDTHQDNFGRTQKLMETFDPAMSSLLNELERRIDPQTGAPLPLSTSTTVLWMGDFGRTPTINGNDGRDHYPAASSCVLAGAGIRTGMAYGTTDSEGANVVKDPVKVPDLMATLARVLGLDPTREVLAPSGRPIALTDHGSAIQALLKT
jgi:uncharacterized protein (DUF1501 family)